MAEFIIEHIEGRWQVFSFHFDLVQQQFTWKPKFLYVKEIDEKLSMYLAIWNSVLRT